MKTVKFTACKFLDYRREKYVPEVTMNLIGFGQTTKVTWQRKDIDNRWKLCQFCQKRGRINSPTGCLDKSQARCGDYEDFEHSVPLKDINLD